MRRFTELAQRKETASLMTGSRAGLVTALAIRTLCAIEGDLPVLLQPMWSPQTGETPTLAKRLDSTALAVPNEP